MSLGIFEAAAAQFFHNLIFWEGEGVIAVLGLGQDQQLPHKFSIYAYVFMIV